ncbi:MAG: MoaD/ThiS family protein [Ruminococcaceae bacterium]|jgi:molybdopterin converting factor small subunit|nr:MoaD/ThiS family protein [Oscillospiraceae bacterium]
MIRVKVFPLLGCDRGALDERSWMELEDGSTVGDALRRIRMSPLKAKLLLLSVNGERAPLSRALHDGDVIGFFLPVSGG